MKIQGFLLIAMITGCSKPIANHGLNLIEPNTGFDIRAVINNGCAIAIIDSIYLNKNTDHSGLLRISTPEGNATQWTSNTIQEAILQKIPNIINDKNQFFYGKTCRVAESINSEAKKNLQDTPIGKGLAKWTMMEEPYLIMIDDISVNEQIETIERSEFEFSSLSSDPNIRSVFHTDQSLINRKSIYRYEAGINITIYSKSSSSPILEGKIWVDQSINPDLDKEILEAISKEWEAIVKD